MSRSTTTAPELARSSRGWAYAAGDWRRRVKGGCAF